MPLAHIRGRESASMLVPLSAGVSVCRSARGCILCPTCVHVWANARPVSYTHLRAHETSAHL
eukprot:4097908-Alexandrium_andersonii.AAC.1